MEQINQYFRKILKHWLPGRPLKLLRHALFFTPTYRQVLSGLDLDVPFGIGYTPKGTSSVVSAFGPDHGGDVSFGANVTYLNVWKSWHQSDALLWSRIYRRR